MTDRDIYERWLHASALKDQLQWKEYLWELLLPEIRKVAYQFLRIARQNGTPYDLDDLVSEAYMKFDAALPKLNRYDLTLDNAITRMVSAAVRRRLLDLCCPARRRNDQANVAALPPIPLASLTHEPASSADEIGAVIDSMARASTVGVLPDVLNDILMRLRRQGTKDDLLVLARLYLEEPPLKKAEIARMLHRSPSWVTEQTKVVFHEIRTCLEHLYPDIVADVRALQDSIGETRGRKKKVEGEHAPTT